MTAREVVSVRFSAAEMARLRTAAERTGRTVSDVLRAAAAALCRGPATEPPATTTGTRGLVLAIVWDNGVVGPNYQPAATTWSAAGHSAMEQLDSSTGS